MKLVLMAPESLEAIAEMANRFFSGISIENRGKYKESSKQSEPMASLEQMGHIIYVNPSFNNKSLFLIWEIPSHLLTMQGHKAVHLLQMAIDHGGSNSLSKALEKTNLAKEVHADFWKMGKEHSFFMLHVFLTDQGVSQYEKVVLQCFQALRRIEQLQIPEYLLKKLQHTEDCQLQSVFDDSFDYVMRISSELIDEEIETYPDKTYTSSKEVLEMSKSLLLEIIPSQCLYFLVVKPEDAGVNLSRIEKWMESEYTIRKISEQTLKEWEAAEPDLSIGFQPPEELTIWKKDQFPVETKLEESEIPDPVFIVDNDTARIRWVEPTVNGDSVDAFFCITTPLKGNRAHHIALNDVFQQGVIEQLKKEFIDEPQVVWNVEMEGADLCLFFSAPYDSHQSYFRRFFSALKKVYISPEQFTQIRQDKLDVYSGDPSPMDYARQILDSLFRPSYHTRMELYYALKELESKDYEIFQKNYFQEVFLEGAFLGGASEPEIFGLWKEISLILDINPILLPKDRNKSFVFSEEDPFHIITQKTHRKGNALLLLIEACSMEENLEVGHKILTTLLHSEFFEELRTKQHTAYKLHTWQEIMHQKICHCFALQSSTHSPLDLLKRVEDFLHEFALRGEDILTRERFEVIRESLVLSMQKQKNAANKSEDLNWFSLNVERLRSLRYESVIQEMKSIFSRENRKRIAILIEGNSNYGSSRNESDG